MRAERPCQVFNAHLNKTACSFNQPMLGFVALQGPSPEKFF